MSETPALRFWAGYLMRQTGSPDLSLRVNDVLASFLAGLMTEDGRALARFYGACTGDTGAISAVCAIARQSECDDIELTSCVTPGAVVIPIALAHAHECRADRFAAAICRGYEAGIILGRALGGARALPKVWPTLVAAPVMAAVTVSFLKGTSEEILVHAMALALAGTSGRAGRVSGTPSGRWIAFAQSLTKGIGAAEAAGQGFHGDPLLCSDEWWEMQAGHGELDRSVFADPCWPHIDETEFKPFPIARQAATAVEAFQNLLQKGLDPNRIESIEVAVPRTNVAMLNRPAIPGDRISLLCNLGFQLACAAFAPDRLYDPERKSATAELFAFSRRVTIVPADDFGNGTAPGEWPARVRVCAHGRDHLEFLARPRLGRVGDHAAELQEKWRRILHGDDRRDFIENVANAPPGAHAMLWDWVKQRLAKAAQSGAAA